MEPKGLFATLVDSFRQVLSSPPDKRMGKSTRCSIADAALSALSMFFTQTPSFLGY
ncbi:MAG: hypothetical protein HC925_03345 [Coleofasciculaceae cyanobacterium SM2_3_26]|nr:hypothetical protein [Coleofasciculaceae cyanobacterium SM2_3_26]